MRYLLAVLALTGCSAQTTPQAPPLYQPDEGDPSLSCPEDTDLALYAYFCDDQGGISGCMAGTEPSMCDQATSTRHDCACDSLTTCQSYRDDAGYPAVGCLRGSAP